MSSPASSPRSGKKTRFTLPKFLKRNKATSAASSVVDNNEVDNYSADDEKSRANSPDFPKLAKIKSPNPTSYTTSPVTACASPKGSLFWSPRNTKSPRSKTMTIAAQREVALEIEDAHLQEDRPDFIAAESAFRELLGNDELRLSDQQKNDGVISRVYGKMQEGMKAYHKFVRYMNSVNIENHEGGANNDSKSDMKGDKSGGDGEMRRQSVDASGKIVIEKATAWKSVFERNLKGKEAQVFVRQMTESNLAGQVTKTFGNIQVHAVIKADIETVTAQGQEVDLWPNWAPFVEHGHLIGDGVYRFWTQVAYSWKGMFKVRIICRFTRYIDRERGFLVQIGEPETNPDKIAEISSGHTSKILPFTSYTLLAPSVDHQNNPVSFLCQFNILPCPNWFPSWGLRAALSVVAPGICKGFLAGVEKTKLSVAYQARRDADLSGVFALTRQIEVIGRRYQQAKFPGRRILPRDIPVDLIRRSCSVGVLNTLDTDVANAAGGDTDDLDVAFSANMRACWRVLLYFAFPLVLAVVAVHLWRDNDSFRPFVRDLDLF